jgi:hypothetical protein
MELRAFEQFVEWPADPRAMFGVELVAPATLDRLGGSHA